MAILNQSNLYTSGESVTAANLNALIGQATFSTNNGEAVDGTTLQVHSTAGYLMVADGGISATKLAAGAVDASAIGTGTITDTQLASDAVTTIKIADDAVTADKLAHTAVTPGSYTNTNLTVDQQGRITAAANGTASSTLSKYSTGLVNSIGGTTVANNAILTVTHNLGTIDVVVEVWVKLAGVAVAYSLISASNVAGWITTDTSNVNELVVTLGSAFGTTSYTGAYLKVVVIG